MQIINELGIPSIAVEEDRDISCLHFLVSQSDLILDALLGTGKSRPIAGSLQLLLTAVTTDKPAHADVVALDIPTGLNSDTGEVDPSCIHADLTVTLGYPKTGLLLFPGAGHVGQLVVGDIGLPPSLADDITLEMTTADSVRNVLPERLLESHKGTFGNAIVVAGSANYSGAAYLAATAATRVGTGLVALAVEESIHPILASKTTEVVFGRLPATGHGSLGPKDLPVLTESLADYDALLLGCGLTTHPETHAFVHGLLEATNNLSDAIGNRR